MGNILAPRNAPGGAWHGREHEDESDFPFNFVSKVHEDHA